VRRALAELEAGDTVAARAALADVTAREEALEHELGTLLVETSRSAEAASTRARRDERLASWVIWGLLAAGLALALAVSATVVHLVSEIRSLSGLLPICAHCKRIRDDRGYWNQLEAYLATHAGAEFTHGICAECQRELLARTQPEAATAARDGIGPR
jgi:hypothetical protein